MKEKLLMFRGKALESLVYVKVQHNPEYDRQFVDNGKSPAGMHRSSFNNKIGHIVKVGRGHGLCYTVKFGYNSGYDECYFNFDELQLTNEM